MHQVELYGILYRGQQLIFVYLSEATGRILVQDTIYGDYVPISRQQGDLLLVFNFEIKK